MFVHWPEKNCPELSLDDNDDEDDITVFLQTCSTDEINFNLIITTELN